MTLHRIILLCLFVINCSEALNLDGSLVLPDPIVLKGLEWLEKQREPDYGFQQHTHEAITALQLGNLSSWFSPNRLSSQLTVKQMDVEILLNLLRRHESPPSPKDFALYSIALSSLCRDPRQFYGHDLINNIIHQDILVDLEFAVSSLAICTSGNHVRKRQIRRLLDISEQSKQISVETLSMVVVALHCITQDHKNRNLNHYLLHPIKKLGELQQKDGSFGDLKSSALAVQALQATDPGAHYWSKINATNFIRQKQNEDGSFGKEDVLYDTILVILALGPQGLVDIRNFDCHNEKLKDWPKLSTIYSGIVLSLENTTTGLSKAIPITDLDTRNWTEVNESEKSFDDKITVFYTLWVGSNVTEIYSINITTDNNDTFYNVMQLAAQKDNHFSFLSTEWPNGHYVHTLAGYKEEPMSYHYWLLYKLPMFPDPALPPPNLYVAPVGVDELLVEDGDHFLFWYKKL